jgi:hypothetical protein
MQTHAEMQEQIEKLSPAQRIAMRRICGTSKLDQIVVEHLGWKTKVECRTRGFRYTVKLGPRGKTLEKHISE